MPLESFPEKEADFKKKKYSYQIRFKFQYPWFFPLMEENWNRNKEG